MSLTLPAPSVADPREAPEVRWGVIAPGGIANAFVDAAHSGTRSRVVAVGSRSGERAAQFAQKWGIERSYGSYEELVADPGVDAVYVASPHSEHCAQSLLALRAGKPVLSEKAFTRNVAEAKQVLEVASAAGLFVGEAMWARYLPHYDVVRQAVESGLIGEVTLVTADHSQALWPDGPARMSEPELAGGALLDLGVYPVAFADLVLGNPERVTARGRLTDKGVDATSAVLAEYAGGAVAALTTTMTGQGTNRAAVVGTRARLEIDPWFYAPNPVRLYSHDGELVDVAEPGGSGHVWGFAYEIADAARCIVEERLESSVMPHATTLRIMGVMDEIRRQVGVRYPGE